MLGFATTYDATPSDVICCSVDSLVYTASNNCLIYWSLLCIELVVLPPEI